MKGALSLAINDLRAPTAPSWPGAVREDRRQNYGEERFILLGMVQERLLAMTYTIRGERVRLISARFAEPQERRRYHEENS